MAKASESTRAMRAQRPGQQERTLVPDERRFRAVAMLSGLIGPSELMGGVHRSVLDLPLDGKTYLLDHWQRQIGRVVERFCAGVLPVQIMVNDRTCLPVVRQAHKGVAIHIELDASQYRGTAGILHDLAAEHDDDDLLLVLTAGQLLTRPLEELVQMLVASDSDVALITHADGTPSGTMLVRSGVLRTVQPVGFVDMKEQALPRITQEHIVRAVEVAPSSALPIRTQADYVRALRWHHTAPERRQVLRDAFAETWRESFQVVEDGASVHPTAQLHDAVVLRGGKVESGATVIRSVVSEGGIVSAGTRVTDDVVTPKRPPARGGS